MPWFDTQFSILDRIERKLDRLLQKEIIMSKELDDLTAQVTVNSNLLDAATTLINGIADRILAAGGDAQTLARLAAELKAKDDILAAAVVANTVPAPTPPATPAP